MSTAQITCMDANHRRKYPEFDGIRGIAILLTLVYHCCPFLAFTAVDKTFDKFATIGWVGVDMFFVLSGFLITGILYDARNAENYLQVFFARRALRILPLYYCLVFGLMLFSLYTTTTVANSQVYLHDMPWYWLFGVNFLVASRGDWNAAPFDTGILWSLAIEEQFYLIWPFVVWRLSRATLMRVSLALIVCALAFRAALQWHMASPAAIYTLTPARMDTLLVGALAALLIRGPVARERLHAYAKAALSVGTALLSIAIIADRTTRKEGPVMQTMGLCGVEWMAFGVLILAQTSVQQSAIRSLLRSRALMFFGAYSYALYVLHYLVRNLVFNFFPPLETLPTVAGLLFPWALVRAGLVVAAAMAAALLSWYVLESPCLAFKRYFNYGAKSPDAVRCPE